MTGPALHYTRGQRVSVRIKHRWSAATVISRTLDSVTVFVDGVRVTLRGKQVMERLRAVHAVAGGKAC